MDLWRDLFEIVTRPFAALTAIRDRRRLRDGLLALAIALLLPMLVAELAATGPFRPPAQLGSLSDEARLLVDLFARWRYQHRFTLPLVQAAAGLLLWLAAAALIHLAARGLKGRGPLGGYLKLVGYVALAGVVTLPLSLLDAIATAAGNPRFEEQAGTLLLGLSVAVLLWQNVLLIIGAQLHYAISGARATTAVLGPVGCLIVLLLALLVATAALAVAATGARL